MGVLGTNLNVKDETKTVVVKIIDKEDCYEIIRVYGDNEDFNVVSRFPCSIPERFSKKGVNRMLQKFYNDLPIYTCEISHKNSIMSREEAFEKILNATEKWEIDMV